MVGDVGVAPGEEVDEDLADPGRHLVSRRGAKVDIEHPYSHHHREGDQDHGEEQVLVGVKVIDWLLGRLNQPCQGEARRGRWGG